jgi:virulence factor
MIKPLYRKVNQFRKKAYLNDELYNTKRKYAFVGFGVHSLANLYPILIHYGIRLRYICTRESLVEAHIRNHFPDTLFTHDLQLILNDPEIEGVFVSANPEVHAQIVTSLLTAGKKIFVEKPPCSNGPELQKIIDIKPDAVVKVGLQRRYWPGNKHLSKIRNKARSYIYKFYFGPYPQGNVFNELFIHAIDYCIFLFGEFSIVSSSHQKYNDGITTQMHVIHANGISGLIELSTNYSWTDPVDSLSIHNMEELLEVNYPVSIEGYLKPGRVMHLPTERIMDKPQISRKYFSINNLVIPAFNLNTLVLQGFYGEIRSFILLVENGRKSENDLVGMQSLYRILDELKESAYPTA